MFQRFTCASYFRIIKFQPIQTIFNRINPQELKESTKQMKISVEAYKVGDLSAPLLQRDISVRLDETLGECLKSFFNQNPSPDIGSNAYDRPVRGRADLSQSRLVFGGKVISYENYVDTTLYQLGLRDESHDNVILRLFPAKGSTFIPLDGGTQRTASEVLPMDEAVSTPVTPSEPSSTSTDRPSSGGQQQQQRQRQRQQQQEQQPTPCSVSKVHEVYPKGCMTYGGVKVCVMGEDFKEGARVRFGRTIVAATRHAHDLLVCIAPAHEPGVVSVGVEIAPIPQARNNRRNGASQHNVPPERTTDSNESFTDDGISFTYFDLSNLDAALALTCEAENKSKQALATCQEAEAITNQQQPPPGLM